MLSSSS